jgi:hypothetical protein
MRVSQAHLEVDDSPCGQLIARTARLRIRPGETPVWIDASGAHGLFERWRRDAAGAGMPLDGLISSRWELCLALEELNLSMRTLRKAVGALRSSPRRLPPLHLRPWVAVITGSHLQENVDELPEVVMPARISRSLPDAWWSDCGRIDANSARAWELLSASHDCTIKEMVWRGTAGASPARRRYQ